MLAAMVCACMAWQGWSTSARAADEVGAQPAQTRPAALRDVSVLPLQNAGSAVRVSAEETFAEETSSETLAAGQTLPPGDAEMSNGAQATIDDLSVLPQSESEETFSPESVDVQRMSWAEAGCCKQCGMAQAVQGDEPQCGIWRWIPQGMIPYIGPRTPDSKKYRCFGQPLEGRDWRSQPLSISGFAGATNGDPISRGHVDQRGSSYAGLNFGWDYDHYWGIEKRLGFGALNLSNANHQPLSKTGASITGEYRLMYYPLGETRWRPFFTAGVGWSDFYYFDDLNQRRIETVFMVPYGTGLKYMYSERIAFRADLIDELTIGIGPVSTFHYVAVTAGVEFRYGQHLIRMPWHRWTDSLTQKQ
jgi:hypothetical protein